MDGIELSGLAAAAPAVPVAPLAEEDLPAFRANVDAFAQSLQKAGVRFGDPPFILPDPLTPEKLADALTFSFYKLADAKGPAISLIWRIVTAFALGADQLSPIRSAGERVAADMDRGLGILPRNTYHGPQHTLETLLTAHVLALLERRRDHALFPEARLLLMLGALVHDWHHDGSVDNGGVPFRQEDLTLDAALPYLTALTPAQRTRLVLMIRATDTGAPHRFMREALYWHQSNRKGTPPSVPVGLEPLAPLLQPEHAITTDLAALLADANILPLIGLTTDYAALKSRALQDEWAQPVTQKEFVDLLNDRLGRPRQPADTRPPLSFEKRGVVIGFASPAGQFFAPNLPDIVTGHATLLTEMGEDLPAPASAEPDEPEASVDLSVFTEVQDESTHLGKPAPSGVTLESIARLRSTLGSAGFFDDPPFTLAPRSVSKLLPGVKPEAEPRINLAERSADTLIRLHGVVGPVMSALVAEMYERIGLRVDDPVYRAAAGIAHDIDEGLGAGTQDDVPGADRNPYHNHQHILDLILLTDLIGLRATQRKATASSPLARGLILLAALTCHWHHTGKGNRVDGEYRIFHLQDRALAAAQPHLGDMSKELRQSLEILVRVTDPRTPYAFSRKVYNFHVGLEPRPDVPGGCEPLVRLMGDPALCTLCARLNDVIYAPFVGLGKAFSARSLVQLGREIGQPLDFTFARQHLIMPMLSRPPYQGERPPSALRVGPNRFASFTSAEAQAVFNPAMHALLVSETKHSDEA